MYNNDRSNMSIGGITPAMKLKMAAQILHPCSVKNRRITLPPRGKALKFLIGCQRTFHITLL
tara:strand:- start:95 stop:280 length:186 start_codon:yes stop_codon:yes gene_type:complete